MELNGTNGSDGFRGTFFDDMINGFGSDDKIGGSPGNDRIDGGEDNDTVDYSHFFYFIGFNAVTVEGGAVDIDLDRTTQHGDLAEGDRLISVENVFGSRENDTIKGDREDNELIGNGGDDTMEGRDGNDVIRGDRDRNDLILFLGVEGNDRLDGDEGDDQLFGGGGHDTLLGGEDEDQLFGEAGNDTLSGGEGHDLLFGGDGNDTLFGNTDADLLDGEAGVDTANYLASSAAVVIFLDTGIGQGGDAAGDLLIDVENVTGSTFSDNLSGSAGINVLSGANGNDTLAGLGGADTLRGGIGNDTASYAASSSRVTVNLTLGTGSGGDAAGDTLIEIENLTGSNAADTLIGNSFANVLDGDGSADTMEGRLGNDTYVVDNADDTVIEIAGEGLDEVRASISFKLASEAEVEVLRTTDESGTAAITLGGNAFANQIIGNNGDNRISGGGGDDTLIGARGIDTLTGGSGADRFVWRDVTDGGTSIPTTDTIVDFNPLAGDRIDLSDVDANVFAAGNQAFTFIGSAAFSGTPGEVNFVHVNGDTIIQLQTGQAVDVDMAIRIQGIIAPDATMFVL